MSVTKNSSILGIFLAIAGFILISLNVLNFSAIWHQKENQDLKKIASAACDLVPVLEVYSPDVIDEMIDADLGGEDGCPMTRKRLIAVLKTMRMLMVNDHNKNMSTESAYPNKNIITESAHPN